MIFSIGVGDCLEQNRDAIVLRFSGKRKVLGTGALNGGIRTDLTAVFNNNDCAQAGVYCEMWGNTMEDHQAHTARALGLDPKTVTGMNTSANPNNYSIKTMAYSDFSVTCIATAGLEVNGCRVGGEASLHETEGKAQVLPGTVNMLLYIDADLTDGCMTRALVTCSEAKVAALQELMVSDRYGMGIATGSGTDDTIIISNIESSTHLSQAGEHFKLGELIGKTVIAAVKDALYRQSGLSQGRQHNVFRRLERFCVTENAIWQRYKEKSECPVNRDTFAFMMEQMSTDGSAVTFASLYAHLIDQMLWGLILPQEAAQTGNQLLRLLDVHYGMPPSHCELFQDNPQKMAHSMANCFTDTVTGWILASDASR